MKRICVHALTSRVYLLSVFFFFFFVLPCLKSNKIYPKFVNLCYFMFH